MSTTAAPAHTATVPAADRLSYRTIFSYSSIQFGTHAVFSINAVHLLFFYTDTAGLDAALAGYVLAAGHLLDAITNPLMGMLSDGVRWKAGRRRPFYIPGCTITALVWIMLYRPAASLQGPALFSYMLVFYLLYNTARTAFYIPWTAQAPDLTPNYDERSRLAAFRVFFGVPGDMIGGITPLLLAGWLGSQRLGFSVATMFIGVLLIGCGVWCYRGTYELPPPPRPARTTRTAAQWTRAAIVETRAAFSSIWTLPTAVVFAASLTGTIGGVVPLATFRYITKYYFHDDGLDIPVMLLYQAGSLLGVPCWLWFARHGDKKRAYLAAFLGWITVATPVAFCGPEDTRTFLACTFGIGFCGVGLLLVPAAFSADVVAWNALHREGGREGFFYGFWGFLLPCGQALASAIVGFTLHRIGFQPGVAQSAETLHGLIILYIGMPITFLALAAIIFVWYPITRPVYEDIRQQLAAREAAAADGGQHVE